MARILVVDDDVASRDLVVALAEHRGHEVHEASNGAEGLRIAREQRPVLVITGMNMPSMNGDEFVRRLHAAPELAAIEVAFYTGSYGAPEVQRLAKACGVTRILRKPAEPAEILRLLDDALGR
jgi:CheY-like chemotaxis protein